MSKPDLGKMKVLEMLELYGDIINEFWQRGIIRSANSPVADYAEHIVCEALSLRPSKKSTKGYGLATFSRTP